MRAEEARVQRLNDAWNANHQAIAFQMSGDWDSAVNLFAQASRLSPDDPIIHQNLAHAQGELARVQAERASEQARLHAEQQARLQARQQDSAAANNMQQIVRDFAQTVNAAPAVSGGLDFDGNLASGLNFAPTARTTGAASQASALEFGDPMVVDARNVPSGLPASVEAAIPDTPAGDSVRKGLQAIAGKNWDAALAWFQDALNQEPGDPGLERLVDLARYTQGRSSEPGGTLRDAATSAPTEQSERRIETGVSAELERALNDYDSSHPASRWDMQKDVQSDADWLKEEEPGHAWKQFFRMLTPALQSADPTSPVINSGIRG